MSGNAYSTMASMMGQKSGQVGIPTQGFAASNIIGTAVPAVGDQKARPNYPGNVGGIAAHWHTIGIAVAVIGIGYVIYHFNFEK
jgi:hypothetical protein